MNWKWLFLDSINDVLVDVFIFDTSKADGAFFNQVFSGILKSHLKNATAQVEPARKPGQTQQMGKINNSPSTCSDAFSGLWNCGRLHDYFSLLFIVAIFCVGFVFNLGPLVDIFPNSSVKSTSIYEANNV